MQAEPNVYSFPKSARLLRSAEYTAVFRHAELNVSAGPLRIRAIKNRMRCARLGLVVTKKGNPKANRRNRLKRIIREQFRLTASALPNVDIVVQVFGEIDDARLAATLQKQFKRIGRELDDDQDRQ